MKKYLPLSVLGVSLAACQKDNDKDVVPTSVTSAFDQKFTLRYQQQAMLPASAQPELTLELGDFNYTFCPENANCFMADFVSPTLNVTDERGQVQQLKLGLQAARFSYSNYPLWIDTASVRANGKRYLVYYQQYSVDTNLKRREHAEKKHLAVELRVVKPNGD
ncbi:hypothetical protein [uncultured Hymenobacter sp.]|uniref:hypothetical protein n=1 Tax=uncultured Hymenobacter sp. TaxID=170016 RepID=UPI0035CA1CC9